MKSNIEELIKVIKVCCIMPGDNEKSIVPEAALENVTLVSLLLVQFVSPDVMYNGLPWPEEEFSKVIEKYRKEFLKLENNCKL